MRVRTVKNSSGNKVVQVGNYSGKNFILHKHIGSAKNQTELEKLLIKAQQFLEKDRNPIFPPEKNKPNFIQTNKLKPLGYRRVYAYQELTKYFNLIFKTSNPYLKDLAIMRLVKPCSKLESVELLWEYFGIKYSKSNLHRKVLDLLDLEEEIFKSAIKYAKKHLDFKFQFVFYDVTTLYFEAHLKTEIDDENNKNDKNETSASKTQNVELKTKNENETQNENQNENENEKTDSNLNSKSKSNSNSDLDLTLNSNLNSALQAKSESESEQNSNSNPDSNSEIRKPGFSKDGKADLPQILIGLVVDQNGFPIYYQIFQGNKFEGHTILPVILEFKEKFKIKDLTIVADSGMLSKENLTEIEKAGLYYIIGGRVKQETKASLEKLNQELNQVHQAIAIRNDDKIKKVYQYSKSRASKDNYELKKSLERAKKILQNPAKAKKKLKFISVKNDKVSLNQTQIKKAELCAGIKSYTTNNQNLEATQIIETYHSLWKVEKAFRMSKSDLEIRPVFHRKEKAIKAHILIVFVALAMAKCIELEKGISIKKYIKEIMKILKFTLQDEITGEIISFDVSPGGFV